MNNLRLAIISDDPPIADDVIGSGLTRVNTRLFLGLRDSIGLIVCGSQGYRYSGTDLHPELRKLCIINGPFTFIVKLIYRILPGIDIENLDYFSKFWLVKSKIQASGANYIFCVCGVDPHGLSRGYHLANNNSLPFAVYLVDDFLSGAELSGNKKNFELAVRDVPGWLKRADKIFVISEGLRERIKILYNIDSIVVPLPYEADEKVYPQIKHDKYHQILFIGSLSHFYLDGLRELITIINELNEEGFEPIKLRLTIADTDKLGSLNNVIYKPCKNDFDLKTEIRSSLICFAPYSFDEKYNLMVSTSFPSKILDYLSAGKYILVYGPHYSTSVKYFRENDLNEVISLHDPAQVKRNILQQISEPRDFSETYREIIKQNHSIQKIASLIILSISKGTKE
jgi:hypothetical protein